MISRSIALLALVFPMALTSATAMAQDKPNILIVWGDDIGQYNISAYNRASWATRRPISTASRMRG